MGKSLAYLEDRKKVWGQDQKMSEKRMGSREGKRGEGREAEVGKRDRDQGIIKETSTKCDTK